ncbi:MAG: tetraacyldisaccharide 4'-kinase [Gammaproteobacteria bacterium]|nr:tetraacyldisaccharide 4'-kinase [Gammaproteobacteria bacterium]
MAATLWYGRAWWAIPLLPFAALFWLVSVTRRFLYRSKIWRRPDLPVPVVVVGNITVGGTGKTPVVAWLAGQLREAGFSPAIVSRGYGGSRSVVPLLVSDATPVEVSGDEPCLLRKLTGCDIVVCVDRVAAVRCAAEHGANVVIADDGLQHYRMRRAVEIVVIDSQRGTGNGWLLPAGPLRESRGRLKTVDAVLSNGDSRLSDSIPFQLPQHHAVSLADGRQKSLDEFSGEVWAVAGIGNPQRFYDGLRARGLKVLETDVPDHGHTDIERLVRQRPLPVLMTEKDAVKYRLAEPIDAWYVPVRVVMDDAAAARLTATVVDKVKQWQQSAQSE